MFRNVLVGRSIALFAVLMLVTTYTQLPHGAAIGFFLGHLFKSIEVWLDYRRVSNQNGGIGWEQGVHPVKGKDE